MNIIYLGNSLGNPICRDAEGPYAESLGFKFLDLSTLLANQGLFCDYDLFIIDGGWKTREYLDYIVQFLSIANYPKINYYIRIVDDNNGFYTNLDCKLYHLIKKYNCKIIGAYDKDYFDEFKINFIPYHYLDTDEINGSHSKLALMSGFNNSIYKLRSELYKSLPQYITKLNHPGYSGSGWSKGKLGSEYINYMSEFRFVIVTTANDFELLKYVECAESGSCPIGEFPTSLLNIMPEPLKILHCNSADEVYEKINNMSVAESTELATLYRNFMKEHRSKRKILNLYNSL